MSGLVFRDKYHDIDRDKVLTPEILATLPQNIPIMDKLEMEEIKFRELVADMSPEELETYRKGYNGPPYNPNKPSEDIVANETEVSAEVEVVAFESASVDEPDIEAKPVSKPKAKPVPKTKASVAKAIKSDYESIRNVDKSVISAVRKVFPVTASKADLISAVVYIFTDGNCEISDKAMEIVKSYKQDDGIGDVKEQLAAMQRQLKRQSQMLQTIELCTCYNTFDRRYGSQEKRVAPKYTEFREKGNLDMLERVRQQAEDQRKIDEIQRGRQIYYQTKDKND